MRKAQAAVELTVLAAFIMLVLFMLFEFGQTKLNENTSVIQVSQARNTVDRLAEAAIEVHNEGVGARRKMYVTIPDSVNPNRILIGNGTITIGVYVANGTSDISSSQTGFTIMQGGFFPTTPGSYWVWVIGKQGYVQIGSSIDVNPLAEYFELFPNNFGNQNISFTNYGTSPVNITLTLVWSDSEISTAINGSSTISFSLQPDTSNLQIVNLNASANSNASRGLHNGYISVTTNISESETIPITVNVVGQPAGLQNISYMTIDTYSDSSYAYSNWTFVIPNADIVYYKVKSYSPLDTLTNSAITVKIYDPYANLAYEGVYSPNNGTGTYASSYNLSLSPNPSLGTWKMMSYEVGGISAATYFSVTTGQVCIASCTFSSLGICNSSCWGINGCSSSSFNLACNGSAITSNACSNSTGGTSGTTNFQASCCLGTVTTCSNNSLACNPACNGSYQNCTYPSNPAICSNTCSEGSCVICSPSCGTETCTSCGLNSTSGCTSQHYCSDSLTRCIYADSSCNYTCSGNGVCTSSCIPSCAANSSSCASCGTTPTSGCTSQHYCSDSLTRCTYADSSCSNTCNSTTTNCQSCTPSCATNPSSCASCGITYGSSCSSSNYCIGSSPAYNCTYSDWSCAIPCSGGSCGSCFPCYYNGCTSCGTTTINCSSYLPYCYTDDTIYRYPANASCYNPCSGPNCGTCTPTCTASLSETCSAPTPVCCDCGDGIVDCVWSAKLCQLECAGG
ncbi:hypothetical protein H0N99_01695 [Candidatus Micrarchaeota archaeon]|nr:hypothetical protein [Candidatus Micrarchaeota archaeon]